MMQSSGRYDWHWHQTLVLGLVALSFFMTALVSGAVFERLPHLEDELAYLFQAKTYARGDLVIETPQPRRAFWQPFVVDLDGLRFGKYSPGWPMLLAPGVALGQPWVINAFFAALTVALVYRLGREIFNRDVGTIAAALTALSPMALLLNATLMGHTTALFGVTLFMYAYWRIERRRNRLAWGLVAGLALGSVVANRPLTGIGVALPFVVWSMVRLGRSLVSKRADFWPRLQPLVLLGLVSAALALSVPLYSYAATGDPTKNLYTLVWWYDTVGFGDCCGRAADRGEGGHDLERGVRHMRYDLSLTAADLFGWQIGTFDDEARDHVINQSDYYPNFGLSWVLLPFGLLVAFRRSSLWVALWLALGYGWLAFALDYQGGTIAAEADTSYLWMGVFAAWLTLPLLVTWRGSHGTRRTWAWMLAAVAIGLVGVQLMYWIGSQRYSTRYYFEMLTPLALLSALPLAWLARRIGRLPVYVVIAGLLVYSVYAYSTPRISALYRFNLISTEMLEGIEQRRQGDEDVLVIVNGANVRWRPLGVLMAVTSPYFDSDIVGGWAFSPGVREELIAQFPDRQVIELGAEDNDWWFLDEGIVG